MDRFTIITAVFFIVISHLASGYAMPSSVAARKLANQTFSIKRPDDYPEDLIDMLLENTDFLFKQYSEPPGHRYGTELKPTDECPSTSHNGPIYEIKDEQGYLRIVVQSEKKFKQIVKIEQCDNPGPLKFGTINLSQTQVEINKMLCQQCMLNYNFLVLSLDRKSLETARIAGGLPVCCSCKRLYNH